MNGSRLRALVSLLVIGAGSSFGPISARAQPPVGVAIDADSAAADEQFKRGKIAYGAGRLQEAYEAYLRAWQLKQSHDIASNLGNTELQLGLRRDAAEHLGFCVRHFPPTADEAKRANTLRKFEQARADVGALSIKTNVRGAEVFIDGKSVGIAPLEAEVYTEAGERVVEARLAAHEPTLIKVHVVKAGPTGPAQEVVLQLVPKRANGPALVAPVSPDPPPVAPPRVDAGPEGPNKVVLAVGGSLAGAGLIAGVVLTVVANQKASDAAASASALGQTNCSLSTPTSSCAALSSAADSRAALSNAAVWSYIGAGAFGVGTLLYGVIPRKAASATSLRVQPMLGGDRAGALVQGVW